ncbi:hypothetical protein TELCIR_17352 [Teladorsagia circumcincta]|uniref:Uncharacterized protein n=1 Tax=Teladorsagia circumcincta TaxID=45464 RepID=A0A2G9TSZ8_TELCI|nr:hypothetical protein TELCIR_17352 [Teladorsagia circumcincta]
MPGCGGGCGGCGGGCGCNGGGGCGGGCNGGGERLICAKSGCGNDEYEEEYESEEDEDEDENGGRRSGEARVNKKDPLADIDLETLEKLGKSPSVERRRKFRKRSKKHSRS